MGSWQRELGITPEALSAWTDLDLVANLENHVDLPIFVENDGTAAAAAFYLRALPQPSRRISQHPLNSKIGITLGCLGNPFFVALSPCRLVEWRKSEGVDDQSQDRDDHWLGRLRKGLKIRWILMESKLITRDNIGRYQGWSSRQPHITGRFRMAETDNGRCSLLW
jgi:hypothetical protein